MNKIVLDKEEVIVVEEDLDLVVSKGMIKEIYLCSPSIDATIHYEIEEGGSLNVHHYSINSSLSSIVHLKGKGASVHYFYSTINEEDHTFSLEVFHDADHTESKVISHGVNVKEKSLIFDINPYVPKEKEFCVCNQENSIINLEDGLSLIRPNLLIDCYNVSSSHSAYIGSFRDEVLFYLMSRGLSKDASYEILMKSFLVKDILKVEKVFPEFLEKLKDL